MSSSRSVPRPSFNSRLREEATPHESPAREELVVSTHASVRRRPAEVQLVWDRLEFQLTPP